MSAPILTTKLAMPHSGTTAVARPRLIERLDEGLYRKLTLLSAPAGFGKTTLAREWVAACGRTVAWLSLDEADSDPARMLAYLVAALQRAVPALGEGVTGALQSSQPPPIESSLTTLLNEIATLPEPLVLVLDDYHLVDAQPIDDAIAFLLEHLPPQLHLVITTRADPRLPLARLRARGQMTELRAAELRFAPDEAAAFLNGVMGLGLSAGDVAALETRTEGWIAGLQLAALSMRGRDDIPGFIRAFAGDDRYIVDYLVEEVLRRQPGPVRSFLLQTSILSRLSGPLCDAVTCQEHGHARLEALERGNVFVVPLDDRRRWYRYHHLFAEVLQAHLLDEHPDQVSALHRRASEWYERNGERSEAIRHALAAKNGAAAADLVELAMPAMRRSRQEATLLGWLRSLPDEVVRRRPVLSVDYAGVLLQTGALAGVEERLRDAERWLASSAGTAGVDDEAIRALPGWIAIYRAGQAQAHGDVGETMRHAGQALDLLPADEHLGRGAAAGLLGLASWTSGDLATGHRMYTDCMARLWQAGFIVDTFGCALALADIRIAQGRLHEALSTFEQALRLAADHGDPALRGTADMHVGIGALHRERNDLDAATRHLRASEDLGERSGLPQNPYRWCVAMARVREAQGDPDGALALLDEAERRYVGDLFPAVRPVAAMRARVWVAQSRLGDAIGWARERCLSAEDDLSYLREFEHITLARVLLARNAVHEAMGLLERLLPAAEAGGRMGSVIEILLLQAIAHQAKGDIPRALGPLERALILAEPEGYVRVFVDEGPSMARLLAEASARGIAPHYTGRLLAASDPRRPETERSRPGDHAMVAPSLIEPLSSRELEVLRLIADGRSNREIGDRLYLALDTVKGHNRRVFAKLGVQRRTEAISRARELGLLQ